MLRGPSLHAWFGLCILAGVTSISGLTWAEKIYVDPTAAVDGSGATWADAHHYLQDALAADQYAEVICVAAGVQFPDRSSANPGGTGDRTAAFQLVNGVGLFGGFPPGGGDWPDRDPSAFVSKLSGDLAEDDPAIGDPQNLFTDPNRSDNSYHVVTGVDTDANTVLDGFTVCSGHADGPTTYDQVGGGIYHYVPPDGNDPATEIRNCVVTGNSALAGGGGIGNMDASVTVVDCVISDNATLVWGGGMYNYNFNEASPRIGNCSFLRNVAIGANIGDPNFQQVGRGGGVANHFSSPLIINTVFSGNRAQYAGGGMYNASDLAHHHAPELVNCTFSENVCTGSLGGAIRNYGASLIMTNSVLWGNQATNGPQLAIAQVYVVADVSYCDVQGGLPAVHTQSAPTINWGPGNITLDPNFRDADGDDDVPGTVDDDLRLRDYSPCIDAGQNSSVPADVLDLDDDDNTAELTPIDRDWNDRIIDGDMDSNAVVDMGAYEYSVPPCWLCDTQCQGDIDCDGDVDTVDWPTFRDAFGATYPEAHYNPCGDMDHDGDVDTVDWPQFRDNFQVEPLAGGCPTGGTWPPY